jgi:hypothetical protein
MLDLLSFSEQACRSRHCLKLSRGYGATVERALKKVGHCGGVMRDIGHGLLLEIWRVRSRRRRLALGNIRAYALPIDDQHGHSGRLILPDGVSRCDPDWSAVTRYGGVQRCCIFKVQ